MFPGDGSAAIPVVFVFALGGGLSCPPPRSGFALVNRIATNQSIVSKGIYSALFVPRTAPSSMLAPGSMLEVLALCWMGGGPTFAL